MHRIQFTRCYKMKWFTFLLLALLGGIQCSKILMVFPFAAPSHYILGSSLAKGLAEAGHNITMVSPFGEKQPSKNWTYRDIVLTGFVEERKNQNMNMFERENVNSFIKIPFISTLGLETTRKIFEHPNFQELINSDEEFDVVIVEAFLNEALNGIATHFKAPLILLSTIGPNSLINSFVGNPSPSSYIPEFMLSFSSDMDFCERVYNWLFSVCMYSVRQLYYLPAQSRLMQKYLPGVPDLETVNKNISVILLNSHESVNQAVPHVPNMIDIGGFHVAPAKQLPLDLQTYMDTAKEGVVLFSMGSNIKPSDMPEDKRQAILNALGKLKQKVLWKWNEDDIPGKPDNVKLSKWLPQQDILGHPNTKLFITHGGLLSTTETIYHGVPILAFPIFGDQKTNAARAEKSGFGITLPFSEITEEKLNEALNELLNKKNYRKNAKRRSKLMHDRPVEALDLAKYWVEFVIRHQGAPHLRVAGADLPLYKYLLLDVIFFVVLVGGGLTYGFWLIARRIFCKKNKSKTKQGKVKKN